jgi:replicative DNA helicase
MTQALENAPIRPIRETPGRVPPHDLDAEESLLGAMLLSRDAIAAALECCSAGDFYKPAHGVIFEAVCRLYTRGEAADPVTVADELRRSGALESIGEPSILLSLQVNTPSTANAFHYARIVEEHSLLRKLVGVAGEIAELGYSVPEDVSGAIDTAEAMVFEVAQRRVVDTMSPIRDLLAQSLDHLEALVERGEAITGVPTGYADLDEQLAGLQKSNLVVVGARPSAGKTSFGLGMVVNAAVHAPTPVPVLMFSLEMSHLEITQRMLCAEARVDATRMRNGRLLESDWPKISNAIGRLGDAPIYLDDNPNVTIMDIRAKARRLKAREGLGLVVVDYLQLMTGHSRSRAENRQVEVSEISRGLKVLARELDIPVVALSQLSRNLEMRQDKRPVLADLRESGCLTSDTRIMRFDTGAEVAISELLATGERDIKVWAVDDDLRLVPATMTHVFSSGVKRTYELRLASGRRVQASANHPFRTMTGWRSVGQLSVGDRLATVADRFTGSHLGDLSKPDVLWDEIVAIDDKGDAPVYDATVSEHHNFVANGIVAHNSIEQDADVVLFIYRDELYNPDSPERGMAEVIVAKHRNGPTGVVQLAFVDHHTRFENLARV